MKIVRNGKSIRALAKGLIAFRLLREVSRNMPVMTMRSSWTTASIALAAIDVYGFAQANTKNTAIPA